jgi:hypothetical protein
MHCDQWRVPGASVASGCNLTMFSHIQHLKECVGEEKRPVCGSGGQHSAQKQVPSQCKERPFHSVLLWALAKGNIAPALAKLASVLICVGREVPRYRNIGPSCQV